ncbi:hypothetical protein ACH3VR_14035 [Microbacterium sp. B2969]|uniref:Uncharacterized protein n=1 Tax=Microbacterium alkaliflavum TaxID=3248839 RepID=A0ABW7Q9C5_9MICO
MTDRAHTEEALYRTAVTAVTHYEGRADAEPGYTIDEDLDWCMQPLAGVTEPERSVLRGLIRATIVDPTRARQALVRRLAVAADD